MVFEGKSRAALHLGYIGKLAEYEPETTVSASGTARDHVVSSFRDEL